MKQLLRQWLSRLRGFMQADIVAMQADAIAQILHIRAQLEIQRTEQEQLRLTLERLQFEHEGLRAILDRLDLFDQTANSVENALLSLALLRDPDQTQPSIRS